MRNLLSVLPLACSLIACSDSPTAKSRPSATPPVQDQVASSPQSPVEQGTTLPTADAFVRVADAPVVTQRTFFNERNTPVQSFSCPADRDTVLVSEHGTRIHIEPNTFVDAGGNPVTGNVRVTLREALDPYAIVNCGLYTTYEGQPLQSGGMLEVAAFAGERPLRIARDRSIGVEVPSEDRLDGMSLFVGEKTESGIDWKEPEPIPDPRPGNARMPMLRAVITDVELIVEEEPLNIPDVSWTVKYHPDDNPPAAVDRMMCERFALKGDSLRFPMDSVFIHNGWNIRLHPGNKRCKRLMHDYLAQRQRLLRRERQFQAGQVQGVEEWGPGRATRAGTNGFQVDESSSYVFKMKQLGWANIDRLFNCPNTKHVELVTNVSNAADFKTVYISMIVPGQRMFLPGYKKADGTYGFSHGDQEQMRLPVGDEAIILATAYVDGKPWYARQTIRINAKQRVDMILQPTTAEKLREDLMATL